MECMWSIMLPMKSNRKGVKGVLDHHPKLLVYQDRDTVIEQSLYKAVIKLKQLMWAM